MRRNANRCKLAMKKNINENINGLYRTWWEYNGKFYEAIMIILRSSNDTIIGIEICSDTNEENGGIYFLNGTIEGKRLKGEWWKLDNSQHGEFDFNNANCNRNQWRGKYTILKPKHKKQYNYTFNYLRGIK